jgi:predicted lipid-binding transport protein (Tim44 family)
MSTDHGRPRRSIGRALAVTALGLVGATIGGMAGSAFVVVDMGIGTVLMLVGMWLGLTLGIWLGFRVTRPRPPRPPIDPARYPNRVIRRR